MYLNNITPRIYQQSIVDNVLKKGSSLIVLPTGLGKTIIALMIIDKILEKKGKVLFLAPTKPLVEQHFANLNKNLPSANIKMLTGATKPKDRKKIFQELDILVATPQTMRNELTNLDKDFFALIIFDEAHRASGKYSYVEIANHFNSFNIALTASPGNNKTKIKEVMKSLKIENIEIKTETDPDVLPYVNPIKTYWVKLKLPEQIQTVNELLKDFLKEQAKIIRRFGFALRQVFTQTELIAIQKRIFAMINENKNRPELYQAISIVSAMMKIEHAITLLETQGVKALLEYFERLDNETSKASKKINNNELIKKAKYILSGLDLLDLEHPKIKKLQEIILQELNNNPNQKIIVFNHYRDSVEHLETILNKNPLISAKKFVGQAKKGTKKGLNQKQQKEIIEDFKNNKYNVLLATSVAEEGLDIPKVDTVIFYEPIPSDIRAIQRRGRTGRFKEGKVYILITEKTRDEAFYWASKNKEKHMKNALLSLSNKALTNNDKINKVFTDKPKEPKKIKTERQTLITELFKKPENVDKATIFVDTRERNSKTYEELKKKDVEIVVKQLDIGDYQVGEETIVERKSASDFVVSLLDGRLFKQALKQVAYEKPVIIIEGNIDVILHERNIRKEQIYGALFALIFEFKIPVLFALNYFETADIIFMLAKREQLRKQKPLSIRKVKKTIDPIILKQYILEGLPNVGPTLALRLLEKYGSVKKIFNLSLENLKKIEGIGKKKAEEIYNIINDSSKKDS